MSFAGSFVRQCPVGRPAKSSSFERHLHPLFIGGIGGSQDGFFGLQVIADGAKHINLAKLTHHEAQKPFVDSAQRPLQVSVALEPAFWPQATTVQDH